MDEDSTLTLAVFWLLSRLVSKEVVVTRAVLAKDWGSDVTLFTRTGIVMSTALPGCIVPKSQAMLRVPGVPVQELTLGGAPITVTTGAETICIPSGKLSVKRTPSASAIWGDAEATATRTIQLNVSRTLTVAGSARLVTETSVRVRTVVPSSAALFAARRSKPPSISKDRMATLLRIVPFATPVPTYWISKFSPAGSKGKRQVIVAPKDAGSVSAVWIPGTVSQVPPAGGVTLRRLIRLDGHVSVTTIDSEADGPLLVTRTV